PGFRLMVYEVEKLDPALFNRNNKGQTEIVRYDMINAMLLNEFLKEHTKVEEQNCKLESQARSIQQQEDTITRLNRQVETLLVCVKEHDSKIQRVIDQVEMNPVPAQLVESTP